ncbi:MAG TPA: hypothetical protein VJU85_04920, partial [Nitrososphaeraceae archaeon]|nr:hypothetical protein [Nitrososphaeraceae archaeon]
MVFWIRLKNSDFNDTNNYRYIRIEEKWQNYFYVASNTKSKLEQLVQNDSISSLISSWEFVNKSETITDIKKTTVLKLVTLCKN